MQYLVQMTLAATERPVLPQEGISFIEESIFPTLERAESLQSDGKILAGGPVSGAVALALIVSAESPRELDDLITSLPVWPQMETRVTPLTTFDDRRRSIAAKLDALKMKPPR